MAIRKRGKFFHYQFEIDGQSYRGTTKETVKSRAGAFSTSTETRPICAPQVAGLRIGATESKQHC